MGRWDDLVEGVLGPSPSAEIEVPVGHQLFAPEEARDTEGSQSFSVQNGTPLDQRLSFVAGSVIIDNHTSAYINVPDATKDGTGRFVPPGIPAAFPILGHISRARINWTAPPGKIQTPVNPAESAQVIFSASPAPLGLGVASPFALVSKTYSGATGKFTPPATPTDVVTITGVGVTNGPLVRIQRLYIVIYQTAAAQYYTVSILKRTSSDTGGGLNQATADPHQTGDSALGTMNFYTVTNPAVLGNTFGSGKIRERDLVAGPIVATGPDRWFIDFSGMPGKPPTLGVGELLAVNLGGQVLGAGFQIGVEAEWTEE